MTSLSRLATDSGGRYTENTNDLSIGFRRAKVDQSCSYTLGFYVDDPEMGKPQNVIVRLKRPGLRPTHAQKYMFRTETEKRQSLLRAAWAAPEMFPSDLVRAHIFPIRPTTKKKWEGLLAVSFPVPLEGRNEARDFGAILSRGATIVHRFNRRINLQPNDESVRSSPSVTFLEQVELRPGSYTLTTVMSDPENLEPHAVKIQLDLPEVPRGDWFLVGPVLGRPSGANLVVTGGDGPTADKIGSERSFEPLLVHQLDEPVDLVAFAQACVIGKRKKGERTASRELRDAEGNSLGSIPDVTVQAEGEGAVHCQTLVDLLPVSGLPGGEYAFEATLEDGETPSTVRFAVQ